MEKGVVKSYGNRLFASACVPMRITINKLYFVPKRVVSGVVSVFEIQEVSDLSKC